jgi:hypothetical protein
MIIVIFFVAKHIHIIGFFLWFRLYVKIRKWIRTKNHVMMFWSWFESGEIW